MPKKPKRYYGRGDLHFVTFSCYRRLPLLSTMRARNVFAQTLGKIRERYKFLLVGYVIMPEHVHLLNRRVTERHAVGGAEGFEAADFSGFAQKQAARFYGTATTAVYD